MRGRNPSCTHFSNGRTRNFLEVVMDILFLKPLEAARRLSLSRSKIYELIAEGELASCRIGGVLRVPAKALERLEQQSLAKGQSNTE
jgi:excisionase family DNA binding protein